jgi:hypothetical protein
MREAILKRFYWWFGWEWAFDAYIRVSDVRLQKKWGFR